MKKRPLIQFASEVDYHRIPMPAKLSIPLWYKDSNISIEALSEMKEPSFDRPTLKKCIPFLDSMMTGYIAELWCDIDVKLNYDGSPKLSWRTERQPLEIRESTSTENLPIPAGHGFTRFAWKIPYHLQTPKNYSCLITHPFNRYDLPFTTLSAVADTHEVMYAGNVPFFLKEGFEGVIEKGTPIYQILPFQREAWDSKENPTLIEEGQKNGRLSSSVIFGWYKKNVWSRKEYN